MDARSILKESLAPALIATAVTTVAVAILSKTNGGSLASGLNSISQMVWGDEAAIQDETSTKYTLTGAALNAAAVAGWAALHEAAVEKSEMPREAAPMLLTGALASIAAYVTDYFIVPKRLRPGFEKRLSPQSMFVVYAALAASIGLGSLVTPKARKARVQMGYEGTPHTTNGVHAHV